MIEPGDCVQYCRRDPVSQGSIASRYRGSRRALIRENLQMSLKDQLGLLFTGTATNFAKETDSPAVDSSKSAHDKAKKAITVKIGRETKGRRGKGVTLVWDLPLSEAELDSLATHLKTRCGTGGTVKDGKIEIQGDQRDRLTIELEKLGYKVKRAGG